MNKSQGNVINKRIVVRSKHGKMASLNKKIYELLTEDGRNSIYHANSVVTSCQFLLSGALLSRGTMEQRKYYQTPQSSDHKDKKYGVWFDGFANFIDIHNSANNVIFYGPVEFVIDIEILKSIYPAQVWVTKLNPIKWAKKSHEQRVFTSIEEFEKKFDPTNFDQMMMFRHCGGEISLMKYLREIILDDPRLSTEDGVDFFSMSYGAIKLAMHKGNIDVPVRRRDCDPRWCKCRTTYQNAYEKSLGMFFPGNIESNGHTSDWDDLFD